jgi:hypothetical protein
MLTTADPRPAITRHDLLIKLQVAAAARSLITLTFAVLVLLVFAFAIGPNGNPVWLFLGYFGLPLLFCALLTHFLCKPMVRCPRCGVSLWSCGTGSFKPRRMRVRKEIDACPGCGGAIV